MMPEGGRRRYGVPGRRAPHVGVRVLAGIAIVIAAAAASGAEYRDGSLRLTLQEAVRKALEGNLDIRVDAYNPRKAEYVLKGVKTVYDPSFFMSFSPSRVERPIQSILDTGTLADSAFIEDRWLVQAGIKELLPIGGTVSLSQEVDHLDSNSTLISPNPQYTSRLTGRLTQPILQGIGDKANRSAIRIANLNLEMSNEDFRQKSLDVAAEVARTYWQLVFDRDMLRIDQQVLDMAEEVYRREIVRLDRGISKQLDVDRARASAETRRGELNRAKNRLNVTINQLRLLMNAPEMNASLGVDVVPADEPAAVAAEVDRAAAMAEAVKKRPEIERARKAAAAGRIRMELADHKKLPKLDAKLSYTLNSLGSGYGEAIHRVYGSDKDSWTASLEFEWPIGNRGPDAEYRRAVLEEEQGRTDIDRLTQQTIHEVVLAIDALGLAGQDIRTTLDAKTASEKVVAGENVRFELGQMTNEELLRAQDFLGSAEREYMRAIVDYNIGLARLGRAKGTLLDDLGIGVGKAEEARPEGANP